MRNGPELPLFLFDVVDDLPNPAQSGFKWSDELTISAQYYLDELEGCAVDPYRIIEDGSLDQHLLEFATFDDHQRFIFYAERNEWETPEDFVLDMILGDHFTSWQSVISLFDNQFDQIGLACDCHPTFEKICVLEVG